MAQRGIPVLLFLLLLFLSSTSTSTTSVWPQRSSYAGRSIIIIINNIIAAIALRMDSAAGLVCHGHCLAHTAMWEIAGAGSTSWLGSA
eukprot:CAMPEP_0117679804 /NCGR_PEP_ID=MMETSP0804-20121206/18005_1 /TAXON_ID=1074897 /ORGANISM="Tetraselmis astigmatica, Strain CCMP880" /LENGTH=87 /DNA_ID=CAMNT_0005489241 /DNA_START=285 /DNA_END=548 /DNA_ORIENTATION=-